MFFLMRRKDGAVKTFSKCLKTHCFKIMSFKIISDLSARACTKEQNTSLWAVFLFLEVSLLPVYYSCLIKKLLRDKVKECKLLGFLYRWHSCLSFRPSVGISCPGFPNIILESEISPKLNAGEGGDHGI